MEFSGGRNIATKSSGKRLALRDDDFGTREEEEDDLSSDEYSDPADDEEDEDSDSDSEDGEFNSERREQVPTALALVNQQHVPRAPWFITEEYTSTTMDNSNDMYLDYDPDHVDLSVGSMFNDKQSLINAIKKMHIGTNRSYLVKRSNKYQLIVKCKKTDCSWRLRAALKVSHGYFQITKLNDKHICMVNQALQDHDKISSRMISKIVKPLVSELCAYSSIHISCNLLIYLSSFKYGNNLYL